MSLSYKEIAEILKIIDSSNCTELVLEVEGAKIVVRRRGAGGAGIDEAAASPPGPDSALPSSTPASLPPHAPAPAAPRAEAAPQSAPPTAVQDDGRIEIRAPMVGTFYRAPSPQAPPFVELGSRIEPGDALCLIEVMKLFTTIEAKQAGRIVEIAAENTALVEYDQLLFIIEPE